MEEGTLSKWLVKEGDQVVITPGDYKDGDVLPIFDFNAAVAASQEGGADGNE